MATKKSNLTSIKPEKLSINIGGRNLNFILDLNSFAELEETYGNLTDLMYKVESGSLKAVRAVLWAGLQGNENPPSEKEVGAGIQVGQLKEYMEIIAKGMGISMPEKDETDPNK